MTDNQVFELNEGFGNRLSVDVVQDVTSGGGGFVMLHDRDQGAIINIDLDIWNRIKRAVDRGIDMNFVEGK